ncbi:MAG: hypothetical protein ABW092_19720 [Candidatus Thiodiazotropha sp.]
MGIARTCCLWIIICLSGTAFGIDSSYIESIEADVAEFTTNEFNPPADSSWLGNKDSETTKQMDLNGFSDHLQDKSPGSFIFFEKLSNEYKQRLLKDYLATGDLERVKQDIFKYTRAMKK